MCQIMPIGLITRWDLDSETSSITHRRKKTHSFEKMAAPISNERYQIAKTRAFLKQADKKKQTASASALVDFVVIATLCLTPWVASATFVSVK